MRAAIGHKHKLCSAKQPATNRFTFRQDGNLLTFRDTISGKWLRVLNYRSGWSEDRDMTLSMWIAALAIIIASLPSVFAAELDCRVVALSDGDTFTCLDAAKQQHKIRLANIDTPEKNQPYGTRARQALSSLIFNKPVQIDIQGHDRYQRAIGVVYVEGLNVNRELLVQGAAWVYPQYNRDPTLPAVEAAAKAAHKGIWGLGEAQVVPPWEWRKLSNNLRTEFAVRKSIARSLPASSDAAAGTCGKRLCGQMTDCADARYHLEHCGVSSLDRDGDGMPCESLCK